MDTIVYLFKIFLMAVGTFVTCLVGLLIGLRVYNRLMLRRAINSVMVFTEPDHTDLEFSKVPKQLKKLVAKYEHELQALGYQPLLTGARRKLHLGGNDCTYHILVAKDKSAILELMHMRMPRLLFGFIHLPFSHWHGPESFHVCFETHFHEGYAINTSNRTPDNDLEGLTFPPFLRNRQGENLSLVQLEQLHREEVQSLIEEGKSVILVENAETHHNNEAKLRKRLGDYEMEQLTKECEEVPV